MGSLQGVELSDLTLSGQRLDLRRWRAGDAGRIDEIMQDPSMREFPPHQGRDHGTGLGSAVVERATGRVVGSAALLLDGRMLDHRADLAYWTAPDARGHGYAGEATRILADWAFGVGLHRLQIACDVRNLASVRTAMRAGFAFEGVARDGIGGDLARFARLAEDPGEPIAPAFPELPGGSLSDGVVSLRASQPDDTAGYLGCDDDEYQRWAFDTERRSGADATRQMARAGLDWLVGRSAQCTILDVGTGRFAGEVQLRFEGPPGVAGFGYAMHPAFRGRGYTTRALRLLVPWSFEIAGFARLELGAKQPNIASQRAALSAGFQPDGVRRARLRNPDGTFADEVCFALENPAFSPA